MICSPRSLSWIRDCICEKHSILFAFSLCHHIPLPTTSPSLLPVPSLHQASPAPAEHSLPLHATQSKLLDYSLSHNSPINPLFGCKENYWLLSTVSLLAHLRTEKKKSQKERETENRGSARITKRGFQRILASSNASVTSTSASLQLHLLSCSAGPSSALSTASIRDCGLFAQVFPRYTLRAHTSNAQDGLSKLRI